MITTLANRQYLEETLFLKENLEKGFLHLGERLYRIKNERLWELDYGSYAEFLMEAKISEATASKLVAIYSKFVLEYGMSYDVLAPCSWSSLYTLLPLATSKEKAEELVDEAANLKRGDVEEKIRAEKHPDCRHDDQYTITVCRGCGLRTTEHE